MVVNQACQSRKIPYPADLPKLPIQLFTDKRVKKANVTFTWIGQVSKVLLDAIPDDSQIKQDYLRTIDLSYPKRPVATEVVQPLEKKSKRKPGPSEEASPLKKKKKDDKKKKPTPASVEEPVIVIEETLRSDPDPQWEEQERLKQLAVDERKAKLAQEEKEKAAAAEKLQKERLAELAKKKLLEDEKEKQRLAKIELERVRRAEEEEEARLKSIEAEKAKKAARDKQEEDDRLKALELEKELEKERLSESGTKKTQEEEQEESGFYSFTPPPPPTWAMGFSGDKDADQAGPSGSLFGADSPVRSAGEEEAEDEIEMGEFEVDTDDDPDRDTDHVTRKEYKKMLNLFSVLLSQQERQAKEISKLKRFKSAKVEKAVQELQTHVKVMGEHVQNIEVVLQQCLLAFVELKVSQGRTLHEMRV